MEPDDTIDLLPSVIIPNVTPAHPEHSEIYKTLYEMLAAARNFRRSSIWIPLERHGGKADGTAFDNTAALISAREEAEEVGAAGVSLPLPSEPGQHFYLEGRADMVGKGLIGQGPDVSIIECVDGGAGIDLNAYFAPRQYAGYSGNFGVWGGPGAGAGIALVPLNIGLLVSSVIENVHSFFADPDEGVNVRCTTTQNSLLAVIWAIDAAVNYRFDAGAANNVLFKSEIAGARQRNLEFRSVLPSTPGQFDHTLYNTVMDTILEGSYEETEHMVYSGAGALNVLRHCPISVNGTLFGGELPTGMVDAVRVDDGDGTGQASLIVDDTKFHGGNACDVAFHSVWEDGARMHVRGGSVGAVPLGFQGNVVFEGEPWFFGTVGQKIDQTGITAIIPRHERAAVDFTKVEDLGDIVTIVQVEGESNARYYETADGDRFYTNGTNPADVAVGRDPATGGRLLITGALRVTGNINAQNVTAADTLVAVNDVIVGNTLRGGYLALGDHIPATTLGTLIGKFVLYDHDENPQGDVPVYDIIT